MIFVFCTDAKGMIFQMVRVGGAHSASPGSQFETVASSRNPGSHYRSGC